MTTELETLRPEQVKLQSLAELIVAKNEGAVSERSSGGNRYDFTLLDGSNFSLTLSFKYPAKIKATPSYPSFAGYNYPNGPHQESIQVSPDRPVEKLYADIERRFLVPFAADYARALKEVEERQAYENKKLGNLENLAAIFKCSPREGREEIFLHFPEKGYGTVRVNGPDSVKVQLDSIPYNVAEKILKLVAAELATPPAE